MKHSRVFNYRTLRLTALFVVFGVVTFTMYQYFTANLQMARAVYCKERIHYITQAMQMYCQDYDEKLPVASLWMDSVQAFVPKVPRDKYAPHLDKESVFQCTELAGQGTLSYGYAFNKTLSTLRLRQIASPSHAPLIYDSSNSARNANDAYSSLPVPPRHERLDPLHAFNYVGYADGHVGAVSR